MNGAATHREPITFKSNRMLLTGILYLLICIPSVAQNRHHQTDSRIHLIHTDLLYKTPRDGAAEILVGNVKLSHEGVYLDCDSARFYREDNSFDAYGHVKMVQGDTLSLTSDSLFYDGFGMSVFTFCIHFLSHSALLSLFEKPVAHDGYLVE